MEKTETPSTKMNELSYDNSESKQESHYNDIAKEYADHYADVTAKNYRDLFIYNRMFGGIQLENMDVLDAMCGMGTTSQYLVNKKAKVTGIDISEELLKISKKNVPAAQYVKGSVLDMPFENEQFDIVSIVGGLHHLHPKMNEGINEILRVLKPNGLLICMEPPKESFLDRLRQAWYKMDDYFEDNEESINLTEIQNEFSNSLDVAYRYYGGGPAYFLICNSLITRVPLWFKKVIAQPLFLIDRFVEFFITPKTSAYVVFRLKKKP